MSKSIDYMLFEVINKDYQNWKKRFSFHIRGTYNSYYNYDEHIKQMYLVSLVLEFGKCDNKSYFIDILLSSIKELESLIEEEKQKISNKNDDFFEDWKKELISLIDEIKKNEQDVHNHANYMVLQKNLSKKSAKELRVVFKKYLYNPFLDSEEIVDKLTFNYNYDEELLNEELDKLKIQEIDVPLNMQISIINKQLTQSINTIKKRKKYDENEVYHKEVKDYLKDKLNFESFNCHRKLLEYLYKTAVVLQYEDHYQLLINQFNYYMYHYKISYNKLISHNWIDPSEFSDWKKKLLHNKFYQMLEEKYPEIPRNIGRKLNHKYESIIRQIIDLKQFSDYEVIFDENKVLPSKQIDELYDKYSLLRLHSFIDQNSITREQLSQYPDIVNPINSIDKLDNNLVLEWEVYELIEETIDEFKVKKLKVKGR